MAIEFNGTDQYIDGAGSPVTGLDCSISLWFKSNDIDLTRTLAGVWDLVGAGGYYSVGIKETNQFPNNQTVVARSASGLPRQVRIVTSTGVYAADAWNHVLASFSASSQDIWLNGVGHGTAAAAYACTPTATGIAYNAMSPPGSYFDGAIAELAMWDAALDQTHAVDVTYGSPATWIKPGNLVFYDHMIRLSSPDFVGGIPLTNQNSPTVVAHPRMLHDRYDHVQTWAAPAAPPTGRVVSIGGLCLQADEGEHRLAG